MIVGHINDFPNAFAWLPEALKKTLTHLKTTDFMVLPAGNYDLQGRDIYIQVIDTTTKEWSENRPEVHRQYIDVQFLVQGSEKIGVVADSGKNALSEDLLKERDLLFYTDAKSESWLNMTPGCFAILFPNDVHRPACAVDQPMKIRKVVAKVKVALLTGA